jgi:uncharacterized protein YbaR (Trm112 family)/ubiquinone/menaquinone biosynthesis C-methylase UbiE
VTVARLLELCVCPDCAGDLSLFDPSDPDIALLCSVCSTVFPFIDGIPVLLPKHARNPALELAPIEAIGTQGDRLAADRTITLLESVTAPSWEWEDEAYWSQHYRERTESKNWNERMWEREPFVSRLLDEFGSLKDRTILDIGCGEGQTFARLLAPHCSTDTLYVGADISLAGLQLNRRLNRHENSSYVLCTASRLPFRSASFDLLCYWGILHHAEGKTKTLSTDSSLLKSGGAILLHEALARLTVRQLLNVKTTDESAHEERVELNELLESVSSLQTLKMRLFHSAFYTVAHRGKLGGWVTKKRSRWAAVAAIDRALVHLGRIVPVLGPAAILFLGRKALTQDLPSDHARHSDVPVCHRVE